MDSIFCKTTSISISTFDSSENKRIINSEEITIEDFTKNIDEWKIPKEPNLQTSSFNLLKTNFTIKTKEMDIQLTKPFETIQFRS